MPGQVVKFMHDSELLRGNRAGETSMRPVSVYLPPQHEGDPERSYPVLFVLAPWTNAGRTQFDWRPFKESLPERLDRLIEKNAMAPCIVVAPDLYTRFGGSQ